MTSTGSQGEQEPLWQQPPFPADKEPKTAPPEGLVVHGSLIVPGETAPPPSLLETTTATVAGIVWPVMIVLAMLRVIDFWPAILIAIVASTVLGNMKRHLRAQRKAVTKPRTIPGDDPLR